MNTYDFLQSRGESYAKLIDIYAQPMEEAEAKIEALRHDVEWTRLQDRPTYDLQFALLDLAAYLIAWAELLQQEAEDGTEDQLE
jgi:hypothetical protein